MTIRESILADVKTTLQAVTEFKSVEVNKIITFDAIASIPVAFVISGGEDNIQEEGVIGKEKWRWTIDVQFFAKDTAFEDLIGKVHLEMLKNERRGGFAITTKRTGIDPPGHVDVPRAIFGVKMHYDIEYTHAIGVV